MVNSADVKDTTCIIYQNGHHGICLCQYARTNATHRNAPDANSNEHVRG